MWLHFLWSQRSCMRTEVGSLHMPQQKLTFVICNKIMPWPLSSLTLLELNSDGSSYLLISSLHHSLWSEKLPGVLDWKPHFQSTVLLLLLGEIAQRKLWNWSHSSTFPWRLFLYFYFLNGKEFIRKMDAIYVFPVAKIGIHYTSCLFSAIQPTNWSLRKGR